MVYVDALPYAFHPVYDPALPEPIAATVVELQPARIDQLLRTRRGYVGHPGGVRAKHHQAHAQVLAGHMPRPVMQAAFWGSQDRFERSAGVVDGQHRLLHLFINGVRRVEVVVPAAQARLFVVLMG
jgi:hypothetical protein